MQSLAIMVISAVTCTYNGVSATSYKIDNSSNTWIGNITLYASDSAKQDYFGVIVSITHKCTIVGANFDDNGTQSGSAYV